MRLRSRSLISWSVLVLSSLTIVAPLAQGDPHLGVWTLNVAKSKYSPGPAPKSATTKIEVVGDGTRFVVDQVMADGTTRHWESTANYDGKDVPVVGNNPNSDTTSRKRINATTVETVSKKARKVTVTQRSVVSSLTARPGRSQPRASMRAENR